MLRLKGNRIVWSRLVHGLVQANLAGGHKTEGSTRRGNRIGTRGGGIVLCGHHDDSQRRERQRREHAVRHAHAHRMDFRPQQDGYYHVLTEETMMKLTLAGLALAPALFTVVPAHVQQPEEHPGQQVQFTGANLPAGGYSGGRATSPTYCYGIPADV